MHRSRASRSAAVFMAGLIAFQLWLVGSGMACTMPPRGMEGGMGSTAPAAVAARHDASVANRSAMDTGMARGPHQAPCQQQGNVPMCQAMGPCVTALAAAPVRGNAAPAGAPERVLALVVLTPPSQTFPPELPPPRA